MGWAQREREAREQLKTARYRVRRWTAFEWSYPEGDGKSARERTAEIRKDREAHLERAAKLVEDKLMDTVPRMDPSVKRVRISGQPQLLFEIVVEATDEDDARRRAMYRFGRGLSARIPTGRGRRQVFSRYSNRGRGGMVLVPDTVTLSPPWGKVEVEIVKEEGRRLNAVR